MSKPKIFGATQSRALRCLWAAKEFGVDIEHVSVSPRDAASRTPEFLAANPSGKVPALCDGDFTLSESMAINLYLARKHGGELQPKTLEDEARTWQWSFWVMTEAEPALLAYLFASGRIPGMDANEKVMQQNAEKLKAPLTYFDKALASRDYILGSSFTVADLNVASVMTWAKAGKLDLEAYPNVKAWLDRCMSRPAFKAASGR